MNETKSKLTVIDGEALMDMKLPPTKFCVETLLPQGISILGGAPKIGKSWMVLDLCIRIAKGNAIWNLPNPFNSAIFHFWHCVFLFLRLSKTIATIPHITAIPPMMATINIQLAHTHLTAAIIP